MLMDFVNGGELRTAMDRWNIPEKQAQLWMAELVLAIEYLHSRDVAHRDIKPENTLLDNKGHLRLTDFGLAKVVETRLLTICGTPAYMAPEVIEKKGHGCGVDWWALGILTYAVLAGSPPFMADTTKGIYEKVVKGEYNTPSHLTAESKNLISKLLTDKTQRLGCTSKGVADIKTHEWFSAVDFNEVFHRRVPSFCSPSVSSAEDTSRFGKFEENHGDDLQALSVEQQALFNFDFCEYRTSGDEAREWIPLSALVGWGCCSFHGGKQAAEVIQT
jgi:serine/threonine protein kinase